MKTRSIILAVLVVLLFVMCNKEEKVKQADGTITSVPATIIVDKIEPAVSPTNERLTKVYTNRGVFFLEGSVNVLHGEPLHVLPSTDTNQGFMCTVTDCYGMYEGI